MKLIVISNPAPVPDEAMRINELFMAGLKYFHLRKPESDIQSLKGLLNGIATGYYERIVLHQYHEMAADFGINRLHYTERARETLRRPQWQKQLDKGFTLSTSIHDLSMLSELRHFDYVFYGPVFNSISKPNYQSKLEAGFQLNMPHFRPKVIALGGVELSNMNKIKDMGFAGAAILGTLWKEPDKATERFIALQNILHFNT